MLVYASAAALEAADAGLLTPGVRQLAVFGRVPPVPEKPATKLSLNGGKAPPKPGVLGLLPLVAQRALAELSLSSAAPAPLRGRTAAKRVRFGGEPPTLVSGEVGADGPPAALASGSMDESRPNSAAMLPCLSGVGVEPPLLLASGEVGCDGAADLDGTMLKHSRPSSGEMRKRFTGELPLAAEGDAGCDGNAALGSSACGVLVAGSAPARGPTREPSVSIGGARLAAARAIAYLSTCS
mmetsp:Transcript_148592/g.276792  ORF Transcript_148592/g.276792 Transcript_148592/m.276792 type:complete len:239 (+) Transcript_148592:1113-1829(+)